MKSSAKHLIVCFAADALVQPPPNCKQLRARLLLFAVIEKVAGVEVLAVVFSAVGAAVGGRANPYLKQVACGDTFLASCGYYHALDTAFAFNIITAIICCIGAVGQLWSLSEEAKPERNFVVIAAMNLLCVVLAIISLVIVPEMYKKTSVSFTYGYSYFDTVENSGAFFATTFLSLLANGAAAGTGLAFRFL